MTFVMGRVCNHGVENLWLPSGSGIMDCLDGLLSIWVTFARSTFSSTCHIGARPITIHSNCDGCLLCSSRNCMPFSWGVLWLTLHCRKVALLTSELVC